MTRAVITTYNTIQYLLIYENDMLAECHPLSGDDSFRIGSIYIGRVEKVVKNIQSAFIKLDNDHTGYLPLNDKPAHVLNRTLPKGLPSLAESDKILVQIEQEPLKLKQAKVTGNISLCGKYVAIDCMKGMIGVSNKIKDEKRVQQLKSFITDNESELGIIFRTACETAPDDDILRELHELTHTMKDILHKAQYERNTGIIRIGEPPYIAILEEYGIMRFDEILTDMEDVYCLLKQRLSNAVFSSNANEEECKQFPEIQLYQDDYPIYQMLGLQTELAHILNHKVWLKSGGFLVIEPTEAMVVVDVNTGKSIGKKKQEEHIFKVNEEAAYEVARQLRLRNLSGIILVDFINMNSADYRKQIIHILKQEFKKDKVATRFIDVTSLELYEITRKKVRKPVYEVLEKQKNW